MDEFNNNQNGVPNGNSSNGVNGEYHFVPPKQPQQNNNPQNANQQQNGYYYQSVNTPNNGQSYQQRNAQQNPFAYNPQPSVVVNGKAINADKHKKNNKALKIVIAIIAVCAVISIVGIVLSFIGTNSSSKKDNDVSASDDASASISDSSEAAKKDADGNYTVAGVAAENMDSCVLISVYSTPSSYDYFFGFGSQNNNGSSGNSTLSGEGSGVIMSEGNGKTYIITCAHVISDGSTFKVTLNDGTEYDASMVGYDAQTDIGVLSINETGLKIATFGDSDDIDVGEQCVAIGCPGGSKFMNSVATGIVSALDRPVSSSIGYDNECIQTDTAINPGNSGGALFNMQGQVIGINSSKIASTEYEGMGFAVPSNTAVETANSLIKNGYVAGRAKLGITYAPITNASNANAILNALAEKGYKDANGTMIVNEISPESDLANKDVKQYDMIVAINGETLTSIDILTSTLSDSKPGDTVTLTIARIENNQIKTFDIDCKLIESKG